MIVGAYSKRLGNSDTSCAYLIVTWDLKPFVDRRHAPETDLVGIIFCRQVLWSSSLTQKFTSLKYVRPCRGLHRSTNEASRSKHQVLEALLANARKAGFQVDDLEGKRAGYFTMIESYISRGI